MSSPAHHKLLIDASSRQGEGLYGVLARILQAATPDQFDFAHVTLVTPAGNDTDWPQASWLDIVRASDHGSEGVTPYADVQARLDREPNTVLMSLNTVRFNHERSVVFMNDAASATLANDHSAGGFLKRLKEKIIARSQLPQLEGASGIISMSCYATAQTAKLKKMQHLVPLGIAPEFFTTLREHRLIQDVAVDSPFVWLTAADPASDAVATVIAAVQTLRDYGACIELKVILPAPDEIHERDAEFTRDLHKKYKDRSFVELIDEHEPARLAQHYHQADGFIWGDRSDHSHAALLRAMASALPVVAPNAEMVKKHLGSKVRFFMHGDANDLANTLERSMADIHFRIIGSSRNHKRSMAYTFEKTAAELFRVVRAYAAADLSPSAAAVDS